MGFSIFWPILFLLALLPYLHKKVKQKAAAAPVTTISLARYRLLASLIQQRKVASGPSKAPTLLFIAAALALAAASQPVPGVPAPGHDVAVVVGVEASDSMNSESGTTGSGPRLGVARGAAKELLRALGPGDPSALVTHDTGVVFSTSLGQPVVVSLETLDSLVTGFGGNRAGPVVQHANRLLSASPAQRRVAVLFNDGTGLTENFAQVAAELRDLPPVEGYLVHIPPDGQGRGALGQLAGQIGWTVVDLKDWSPARVVSGPPGASGEASIPLAGFLALGAFALLALAVFQEARRAA